MDNHQDAVDDQRYSLNSVIFGQGAARLIDDIAAGTSEVPAFVDRGPELVRHRDIYGISIKRLSDDATSVLHAFFGQDGTLTLTRGDRWGRKADYTSLFPSSVVTLTESELGWLYSNQTLWAKAAAAARDWTELLEAARKNLKVIHSDIDVPAVDE